jgi:hypothetical protein
MRRPALLDATASLWYCNVGRTPGSAPPWPSNARSSALGVQDLTNPAVSALADRVAAIAPMATRRCS